MTVLVSVFLLTCEEVAHCLPFVTADSVCLSRCAPAPPPDLVLRHRKVVLNYYRKYLGNYHAAYLRDLAQRIPMAPELESVLMSSFVDTLMRMGGKEGGWGGREGGLGWWVEKEGGQSSYGGRVWPGGIAHVGSLDLSVTEVGY